MSPPPELKPSRAATQNRLYDLLDKPEVQLAPTLEAHVLCPVRLPEVGLMKSRMRAAHCPNAFRDPECPVSVQVAGFVVFVAFYGLTAKSQRSWLPGKKGPAYADHDTAELHDGPSKCGGKR